MDNKIPEQILNFWFTDDAKNKLWIQRDKKKLMLLDQEITQKYNDYLRFLEINILNYNFHNIPPKYCLAFIICLDQFSRHIYRNKHSKNIIKRNTLIAADISMFLIKQYQLTYIFNEDQLIFILMPLKHIDIYLNFNIIAKVIFSYNSMSYDISNLNLRSFWQDCLKKYYLHYNQKALKYRSCNNYSLYELSKVCEYFPVREKPIIDNINNQKLINIIQQFIGRLNEINNSKIIISLSGGPDSMVLLDLLVKTRHYHNRDIVAFHLEYNNRKESIVEKELVQYYCNKLNVDLYTFTIHTMKRDNVDRNFYEKITRELRFKLYKQLDGNVILGHIRDDLIENIWTNFAKGRDLFKLHKMDEFTNIEEVHICRPFLQVIKKDILLYAQTNNVPYLKNTTPKWSNRGKLRNNFIPETYKQFGKSIDDKILYLSNSLASYKTTLDKLVFKPLFDSIIYIPKGLKLDITSYLDMDLHFWQTILQKLFHNLELSMPSIKSIKQFVTRLNNNNLGKITLKKNVEVKIIRSDNITELYISKI